jgi:hypothetical protein
MLLQGTHYVLDGINLFADGPAAPIGALAGAIDAGIYWMEGKNLDASLSLAGTVPGIGIAASVGRYGGRAVDAVRGADNFVDLTGHRAAHILNRHRAGAGLSTKTEFPTSWSDKEILHHVSDIATDHKAIWGVDKWESPYAIGTRNGVEIRVDFYPKNHPKYSGQISTAYPINTLRNP